ncbi:MAG: Ig-like domain-containing protein [Terracidiphilus sp.]
MRERLFLGALLLTGLMMPITGCTNPSGLDSITITPSTESLNVGDNVQLTATGTYGNASHQTTQPVTTGVTWASSAPTVASVVATTGAVTAAGVGTATITATAQGFRGPVTATATVTVGGIGTGTGGVGSLSVIAVLPSAQTLSLAGETTQFTAVGTTTTGSTEYLTNSVTWTSSNPNVATIGATTGLATAVGAGTVTITAAYTEPQSVITGIATLTVSAGAVEQVTSLTITPSSVPLTSSGQQSQLVLLGVAGSSGQTENLTADPNVTWTSSTPTVATVNKTGLVTGVTAGSSTILAQYTNKDGSVVTASVPVTVTITGTGTSLESITSLSIIPTSITVDNLQDTGQFLAIGTFSAAPYVRDVTNSPATTWISSFPNDFPVDTNSGGNSGASAGLVTAFASGSATIIAESTSVDGTIQTATALFNCPFALPNPNGLPPTPGTCDVGVPGPLLATLTVYNEGLNTTNWLITGPSATGTPNVIHCGPGWAGDGNTGGSVCTATYPVGTTVTLTAPAQTGVAFGGWSYNCTATAPVTAAGPNSCTITLTGTPATLPGDNPGSVNATVGAIFN